jgi:TetR/AcrR family transcriptional regulator, acrAB operon repressor
MARRTKEQALTTRHALLDAAERLFQAHGVAGTSLQAIAQAAGATRGAVYWHFKDKADLFNAMLERVTLPMENVFAGGAISEDELTCLDHTRQIRLVTLQLLSQIVLNPQTRRVLEVATQKVEYVEENQAIRARHLAVRRNFIAHCEARLDLARRQAGVEFEGGTGMAACGFHAMLDGLIQNWLLDPSAFNLVESGGCAIDVYLTGLGLSSRTGSNPPIAP